MSPENVHKDMGGTLEIPGRKALHKSIFLTIICTLVVGMLY